MTIKELCEKQGDLFKQNCALRDKAESEKRTLTAEERAEYDARDAEIEKIGDQIDLDTRHEKRKTAMKESLGRTTGSGAASPLNDGDGKRPLKLSIRGKDTVLKPGTPTYERATAEYADAFHEYLLTGRPNDFMSVLQSNVDTRGGYLTTTEMSTAIIKFMDDNVFMRGLATVLPPLDRAVSLGVPTYDTDPNDADWTPEVPATAIAEDTAMAFGKRELTPHLFTKRVNVSMKLLRAAVIDIESFITQRLGYKFAITEEKAFISGNGSQRPLGVFTASADGIPTTRDVVTFGATAAAGDSSTTLHGDDLILALYSLKEQYQRNATWLVSRGFMRRVRTLKETTGQYIWQAGLASDKPATILDRPYFMSEFVPDTFTAGLYVAVLGDFKAGYWIADTLGFEIQRLSEIAARQNQVEFIGRKETDGMPVLAEAFVRLQMEP